MSKAVILLSGGLDSSTCLAIAKAQGFDCYCISFDYNQRHKAELDAAKKIANVLGACEHKIVSLSLDKLGGSALTDKNIDVPDYKGDNAIPITYVPARNTTFLAIALGYAEVINAYDIFIGVSAIDYSGYPDCRPEFITAFENLASLATKAGIQGKKFKIHTPLVDLSKAQTIKEGLKHKLDYGLTVSCYQLSEDGKACGVCDSCILRKQAFIEAGIADPTHYIK